MEYADQRTDLMNKVADVCEERGNRIAELEELVLYYENERNNMTARRVTPSDTEDYDSDTYDDTETNDDTETSSDNDSDNTDNTFFPQRLIHYIRTKHHQHRPSYK